MRAFHSFLKFVCFAVLVQFFALQIVKANPEGGQVVGGSAQITQAGKLLEVQQNSQRAVIDWRSFDIGVDEHTRFIQPNANALALNRIKSLNASQIAGKLSANGNVVLVNPNGVFFRAGSQVDVNGLIASTSGIAAADFMAGSHHFNILGDPNAAIVNHGQISASEAGLIGLVAPQVENHGILQATAGRVQLSAGEVFTLDFSGDALLQVAVPSSQLDGLRALNTGTIAAEGGTIAISASAAKDALDSLVVVDGHLQATGAHQDAAGTIHIGNPSTAAVSINGALAADSIKVRGQAIAVNDTAKLQAIERISVGGDYLGGDGIGNAQTVRVEAGAELSAGNPADQGDGEIIVWSDDTTQFAGYAEAAFVETSGKRTLKIGESARVNTYGGLWLLDPQDFVIANSDGDMTAGTLQTNLENGNVAILSSGGGQAGNGDIIIRDDFSYSANELTLTAARDVSVEAVVGVEGHAALTINTATTNGGDAADSDGKLRMQLDSGGFQGRIDYTSTGDLTINGDVYTIIDSRAELDNMRHDLDGHYAVGANIDLGGSSNKWTPIRIFEGHLEGLGHTLSDMYIADRKDLNGLFGETDGASISNVGILNGTITNCEARNGLLVGRTLNTEITGSHATGLVSNNKGNSNGGLVGYTEATTISDSYATGDVTDNAGFEHGGLVGYAYATYPSNSNYLNEGKTVIENSYATGDVTNNVGGDNDSYSGGLVGALEASNIENSYATGDVTTNSGGNVVGGLVGDASHGASINGSYATGNITGNGEAYGGLVGKLSDSTITNSYATGDGSTSIQLTHSGGLVGYSVDSAITDSYATGITSGSAIYLYHGGLVGHYDNTTFSGKSFYNNANDSGIGDGAPNNNVVGLALSAFTDASNFTGADWDIAQIGGQNTVWRIYDGHSRPLLAHFLTDISFDSGTGNSLEKVYDGSAIDASAAGLTLASGAFKAGDSVTDLGGSTSGSALNQSNVGSYSLDTNFYSTDQQGYDIENLTDVTLTITQKALTISGTSIAAKTYDGTTAAGAVTVGSLSGLVGTESLSVSGSAANLSSANAGSYNTTVSYTLSDVTGANGGLAANYSLAADDAVSASITKKALTIGDASIADKTYDGTTAAGAVTVGSLSGLVGTESLSVSGSAVNLSSANAGSYNTTVSYTLSDVTGANGGLAANYSLADDDAVSASITKKALTIGDASIAAKTYDGTTAAGAVTVGSLSGLVGTESLSVSGSAANLSSANAGSYNTTVSYTLSDVTGANGGLAANYSLAADDAVSASITKKALTIGDASIADKTYDGTTAAGAVTVGSLSGLVGTESLSVSGSAVNLSSANAGSYNTTVSYTLSDVTGANGGLAANYSLADDDAVSASITKKALTIGDASIAAKTYDGTTAAGAVTVGSLSGLVGTESLSVSGSAVNLSSANAGSYNTTVSYTLSDVTGANGGLAANYSLADDDAVSASITKKALTIGDASIAAKTYDGTTAAGAVTVGSLSGLVGTESLSVSGSAANLSSANAGSYNTTVSYTLSDVTGANGGLAANYSLAADDAVSASITKKALTIGDASIADKTYDGTTAAGAVTVGSLSGLVGTESLSVSGSAVNLSSANAGSYNTTVSYTLSDVTGANGGLAANYSLADDDAVSASITKKALTIGDASIAAKTYDGTTAAGAVTVGSLSGLVGTESLSVSGSAANLSSANAGSYNTTVSYTLSDVTGANGGLAANYSLAADDAVSASITKKALTIGDASIADKTYDGTTAAGAVTVGSLSGLVGTESLSVSGSAVNLSSANAGSYNTTVSYTLSDVTGANGGLAANYSLADDDAVSASITKKALTIGDASIAAKTYDGTTAAGAVTVGSLSGLVGTESLSVSGSAANLSSANAGSYNTTVSYTLSDVTGANGGLAANYSLAADDDVSATIAQKALAFSKPTVADKTYDGSDSVTFDESKISFFTPVNGDTIDYKLSGEFTSSTVGKAIPVNVVVQLLGESALNYSLTQADFQLFADIKSALPKSLYKELAQASAPAASPETVVQAAPQVAMRKPVRQVRSGRSTVRGANRIKPQLAPSLSNSQLTIEQVQAPEENTSVAAVDESTETGSKLEIQNSMNLAIEETLVAELGLGQLFDVPLNGNESNVSSESNDLIPNAL